MTYKSLFSFKIIRIYLTILHIFSIIKIGDNMDSNNMSNVNSSNITNNQGNIIIDNRIHRRGM